MAKQYRVAVLGGGSFGTALANIVADNEHDVRLWVRDKSRCDEINREHRNSSYLPDIDLNPALRAFEDIATAVDGCDLLFVAVPSKSSRHVAQQLRSHLPDGCMVISTTKGIEDDGFKLMSQVLREELPTALIGVLSGPNLARELAERQITASVIASDTPAVCERVQELLKCSYFRVYAGDDVFGLELAGALKNCYAIMTGMAAALGAGNNTMGFLLTRALAEMSRFAMEKGADPMTFMGLSGVGDLVVTCTSPLSRNYRVGFALGEGRDLDEVVGELGQVAEGVNTIKLVKAEADRLGVYMPLVNALYAHIYERASIAEVVDTMMSAAQTRDVEHKLL